MPRSIFSQSKKVTSPSYYKGPASGSPSPFRKKIPIKPRSSWLNRTAIWLLALIVIGGSIYSLFVNRSPKIILNSTAYHPAAVYRQAAFEQAGGLNYRTKLTYNERSVVDSLRLKFPEISSASIEMPIIGQSPVIRLTVASPRYIYIGGGQKYILDSDGVIISVPTLDNYKNLLSLTDTSNIKVGSGNKILGSDAVGFIDQIIAQCQSAHVPISALTLPAAAQELDLTTKDAAFFTKFYLGGDPVIQAGQFLSARHDFTANHITPSQYLDVRVSGKVFYK